MQFVPYIAPGTKEKLVIVYYKITQITRFFKDLIKEHCL